MDKFYVRRLRLDSGGYANRGRDYYGVGMPLYECWNDQHYMTFRAEDREHAIEQLRDAFKGENVLLYRAAVVASALSPKEKLNLSLPL